MSRLFGVRVSDPHLLSCVLYPFREDLATETTEDNREGWGMGFYQDDRVLVKKRPKAVKERIDFVDLSADLKSPALIGHGRRPTIGALSPKNTHPFQFRSWLFAHHGMIDQFAQRQEEIENQIPEFLRQHLGGGTDSERLFFLFLAALSDTTRQRLEDPTLRPDVVATALRGALARIRESAKRGEKDILNVVLSNSRVMIASGLGRPLFMTIVDGVLDCPRCRIPPLVSGREPTRVDHPYLRAVLVASGLEHCDTPWKQLAEGSMVLVDRELNSNIEPL